MDLGHLGHLLDGVDVHHGTLLNLGRPHGPVTVVLALVERNEFGRARAAGQVVRLKSEQRSRFLRCIFSSSNYSGMPSVYHRTARPARTTCHSGEASLPFLPAILHGGKPRLMSQPNIAPNCPGSRRARSPRPRAGTPRSGDSPGIWGSVNGKPSLIYQISMPIKRAVSWGYAFLIHK